MAIQMRPVKSLISLRQRAGWSESSLGAHVKGTFSEVAAQVIDIESMSVSSMNVSSWFVYVTALFRNIWTCMVINILIFDHSYDWFLVQVAKHFYKERTRWPI